MTMGRISDIHFVVFYQYCYKLDQQNANTVMF